MTLSGPGCGPFPPVALWINVLGYLIVFAAWMAVFIRQGLDSDWELTAFAALGLVIAVCWAVILPVVLVFCILFLGIKAVRFLWNH
jgi:hypothetical protein